MQLLYNESGGSVMNIVKNIDKIFSLVRQIYEDAENGKYKPEQIKWAQAKLDVLKRYLDTNSSRLSRSALKIEKNSKNKEEREQF